MNKLDLNKMKASFSGLEKFAHKYTVESMTAVAIIVAAFSAWAHLFMGTLGWSVLFLVLGSIAGIFFPVKMDMAMKKVYSFSGAGKQMPAIIAEVIKIAIALFVPFIYFAFLGILTGTAYQYYVHYSQSGGKGSKAA